MVTTLKSIFNKCRKLGFIEVVKSGEAVNIKLGQKYEEFLNTSLEENTFLTLKQMKAMFFASFESIVTEKAVSISLEKLNTTLKFLFGFPDIIYIDETGFNLYLRQTLGRFLRGQRTTTVVPNYRGRDISIAAALSMAGLIHNRILVWSYNTEEICIFVTVVFLRVSKCPKIIIMDNTRFHLAETVKSLLENLGH
ncbi:hypothetical protein RF11_02925 [Thelohanellus kitauei]|uniref:Tc1-like transposase DDE domain-containing protein n=1 Tax=Thelohanellus kitauei TaxID=669202 RepID=A0A0C2JIS7_THEKT|nr:hypothetical protein RF11_02925 [Thelohanellus kitauei]